MTTYPGRMYVLSASQRGKVVTKDGECGELGRLQVQSCSTQLMEERFRSSMEKGLPLIVEGVYGNATIWTPEELKKVVKGEGGHTLPLKEPHLSKVNQGDLSTVDCHTLAEGSMTPVAFFDKYKMADPEDMVKLKDWPKKGTFQKALPKHYKNFMDMVPFKEYVCPGGVFNLTSYYPDGALAPDLGPKFYIACGRQEELGEGDSVTKLHVDLCDAVNVLLHTQPLQGEAQENPNELDGAEWVIFYRHQVPKVREFLEEHRSSFLHKGKGIDPSTDVIYGQEMFLTAKHLQQLKKESGIEPFIFTQKAGEAVFIPAGCPHQVRNLRPNTKAALDFLIPGNASICMQQGEDRRKLVQKHRAQHPEDAVADLLHADKLQVDTLVLSAALYAADVIVQNAGPPIPPPSPMDPRDSQSAGVDPQELAAALHRVAVTQCQNPSRTPSSRKWKRDSQSAGVDPLVPAAPRQRAGVLQCQNVSRTPSPPQKWKVKSEPAGLSDPLTPPPLLWGKKAQRAPKRCRPDYYVEVPIDVEVDVEVQAADDGAAAAVPDWDSPSYYEIVVEVEGEGTA
eukprot:jgi/Botrbrau1/16130/Bobra.7_2s0089.1